MIPGLKFVLTRLIPNCLGPAVGLAVFFGLVLLASMAYRKLVDDAGWVLRDHLKWMFTPRNFIILLPVGLSLLACAAILYTMQWW